MKATSLQKFIWILVFVAVSVGALQADIFDSTKRKEFNRSFAVGTSDRLSVDNRYGNVTVVYWNKSEINIRVEVIAKAKSDSRAQEALDRVNVDLSQSGNSVRGVTTLKSSWGGSNVSLEINYYVSMPQRLEINIAQQYGGINLPEQNDGKSHLEVKYGKISAGNFSEKLTIDGGYSDIAIGNMSTATLDLRYCNLKAKNATSLSIDGAYTPMKFENVGAVTAESSYGDLTFDRLDRISLEMRYASININRLSEEFSAATFDYSNLKIQNVDAGFRKIDLSAKYGNVDLKIPAKAAFNVNVTRTTYGSVDMKGFTLTHSNVSKSEHSYTVNGGGNAYVSVNSNGYSNVSIKAQ
ncbi:MAG: DUF4097 domain-containing protein [Tannerellaceae bacterium]|jgi:hypothetical protein|nr:DUF4097 domain-containing protein [Tannerellaceae bacterium]